MFDGERMLYAPHRVKTRIRGGGPVPALRCGGARAEHGRRALKELGPLPRLIHFASAPSGRALRASSWTLPGKSQKVCHPTVKRPLLQLAVYEQ
jgi:hypothetical protein